MTKKWRCFSFGLLLSFFLVFGLSALPQSQKVKMELTLEQAKAKLVSELYKGEIGDRALFGAAQIKKLGQKIGDWRNPAKLSVEKDAWFFFVDEQPNANWEHEARFVLIDKATGEIRTVRANTPPREIMELRAMSSVAEKQISVMKKDLEFYGKVIRPPIIKLLRQKAYAVLVSGGYNASYNYGRYWNDLSSIYKALKQKYGFSDAEIIVLYANGTHSPNGDLDGDGTNDIDYSATKANLTTVMNFIKNNIPSEGKFFFYSTNHGGQEAAGSYDAHLYLWGEWIRDDEFAPLTKDIKCSEAVYVMEQCYSGGMMDDILQQQTYPCTNPKVCIMTAANYNEPSWACNTEGDYDEYVYYWTAAVFGKTPGGVAVNADTNGDGVVSMEEAHTYAKTHDDRSEHPTIGSCVANACQTTLIRPIKVLKR